jgi:hypothetical protein
LEAREGAARKLQAWNRKNALRRKDVDRLRAEWDEQMAAPGDVAGLKGILRQLDPARLLLLLYSPKKDASRLATLAKVLADGTGSLKTSVVALFLNPRYFDVVVRTLRKLVRLCYAKVTSDSIGSGSELRFLLVFLDRKTYTLPHIGATSSASLSAQAHESVLTSLIGKSDSLFSLPAFYDSLRASLCDDILALVSSSNPALRRTRLSALLRILSLVSAKSPETNLCYGNLADSEHLTELIGRIFAGVPLLLFFADEVWMKSLGQERVLERCVALLKDPKSSAFLSHLDASGLLFLCENLVSLFRFAAKEGTLVIGPFELLKALGNVIGLCRARVTVPAGKDKAATTFHPVFGVIPQDGGTKLHAAHSDLTIQKRLLSRLSWLWSAEGLPMVFGDLVKKASGDKVPQAAKLPLLAMDARDGCSFYLQ